MKIALLHQYDLLDSGSGCYLVRVAEQLLERGHECVLVSTDEHPERLPFVDEVVLHRNGDAPVSVRCSGGAVRCAAHSLSGGMFAAAYPRAGRPDGRLFTELSPRELRRYLDDRVGRIEAIVAGTRPDVLHANHEAPMAAVAARVKASTGCPYVVVAHGSTLEYLAAEDLRFEHLTREGLRRSDRVVALNTDVRSRLMAVCPQIEDRLVTIPAGVDTDVFRPAPPASPAGPPTVAYVGRLSLDKGVHALLAALPFVAARMPGVRVVVVGDGPARPALEAMTRALGDGDLLEAAAALRSAAGPDEQPRLEPVLHYWATVDLDAYLPAARAAGLGSRVRFVGRKDEAEVAAVLAGTGVLVVPSLVREAFPLVCLEALAAGVPPLARDEGGLGAVLDELAGPLGPLASRLRLDPDPRTLVGELAARIPVLLRVMAFRGDAIRAGCRDVALERYRWAGVVERLEAVYEAVRAPAPVVR